jgi:hypothetical protein
MLTIIMSKMPESDIPKSAWGPGPWQDEPDRVEWNDERTGLACRIIRNMMFGHLNGYVGVPPTHPYFGWGYGDNIKLAPGDLDEDTTIDDMGIFNTFIYAMQGAGERGTIPLGMTLKAHQGITWSGELAGCSDMQTSGLWFFGFDCGHAWDVSPGLNRMMAPLIAELPIPDRKYRDLDYVRKEVTALAFQLRQLETRVLIDDGVLTFAGNQNRDR